MKHCLSLVLLWIAVCVHAQLPDFVPTDGLLAWYALDGNAQDLSGNGFDGTTSGISATMNRIGQEHAALNFGSSADTSIGVVKVPGLVDDVVNSFSFAFWAKPTSNAANYVIHPIHGHFFGPDALHAGTGVKVSQSKVVVQEHSDNFLEVTLSYDLPSAATDWHHIVVVYTNGIPQLYFDGAAVAEGISTDRDSHISLGTDPWYPNGGIGFGFANNQYHGGIDDVGFWDRVLTAEEIAALYDGLTIEGCTDAEACNYDASANAEDGTCVFPPFGLEDCEAGGVLCGEGTIWNASTQSCEGFEACPTDLNDDGVIGVTDLMSLLADFGTDCLQAWACGEPLNYQGYDYATVQIGEQCWFAENLRATAFANGDSVGQLPLASEWISANQNESPAYCSMNNDTSYSAVSGFLYNWYAVIDERGICPTGWHVGSDEDWQELEFHLGMPAVVLDALGWRADDLGIGVKLRASSEDSPAWNGSNSSGFTAIPGGQRDPITGNFGNQLTSAYIWTSSAYDNNTAWYRRLGYVNPGVLRLAYNKRQGQSIRCLMD
jgi:uncharacterized protein (TIGR02145 family)